MERINSMEKAASWSSPVFRAAMVEIWDGLQQSWRLPSHPHKAANSYRFSQTNQTSLLTPITLAKVLGVGVAVSLVLTHLQFICLIFITLALAYLFLRQLQNQSWQQRSVLLPLLAPVLISLGALLGSANLGAAAPWLLVVLLAQVILLILSNRTFRDGGSGQTWPELLQELTQADPLRQLVSIETLRQIARQGKLEPAQRQVLRQALQLLLRQEIVPEVRQAILTALPQLSPRRPLPRLADPKSPLYLQPPVQLDYQMSQEILENNANS